MASLFYSGSKPADREPRAPRLRQATISGTDPARARTRSSPTGGIPTAAKRTRGTFDLLDILAKSVLRGYGLRMPDFSLERHAGGTVCGVDEAGRGPWAGPVVAGAVILDPANIPDGLEDSKKLKPTRREVLLAEIQQSARIGVGIADVAEIDTFNILQATLLAMARAVADLGTLPDLALVDGNQEPALACPVRCVVKGDGKSLSIAAASIVAKVTRDRIMATLARRHPGYGWERNAGYGTDAHRAGLAELGVTEHHRRSFAPIRVLLCGS